MQAADAGEAVQGTQQRQHTRIMRHANKQIMQRHTLAARAYGTWPRQCERQWHTQDAHASGRGARGCASPKTGPVVHTVEIGNDKLVLDQERPQRADRDLNSAWAEARRHKRERQAPRDKWAAGQASQVRRTPPKTRGPWPPLRRRRPKKSDNF